MSGSAHIQCEHAYYHVMNRGRGRQTTFYRDEYYQAFLQTLEEIHLRFDAQIHAYCLMGNHYHQLIGSQCVVCVCGHGTQVVNG